MTGFLNDLSFSPPGAVLNNCKSAIASFLQIITELNKTYSVRKVRVPPGVSQLRLAGQKSFEDFLNINDNEYDRDLSILIKSFLVNRRESPDQEIIEAVNQFELNKLIEVKLNGHSSLLLKEAHILDSFCISFPTLNIFSALELTINVLTIWEHKESDANQKLSNFSSGEHIESHQKFLSKKLYEEKFQKHRWNPVQEPCWNSEVTKKILETYNYPECKKGKSVEQIKALYKQISNNVLEANGWIFDKNITNLNNHRKEVWRIYRPEMSSTTSFISVDIFEGEFEIQDRNGKWHSTCFFNGTNTGKKYKDSSHNISVR